MDLNHTPQKVADLCDLKDGGMDAEQADEALQQHRRRDQCREVSGEVPAEEGKTQD